jgi:outer membrane protein OmpA-like peptidoglycan-associated protein
VRFHVIDTDGHGIPGVEVWWKDAPEGCFEQERIALDEHGEATQRAGEGRFRVFVEAEGYELVQRDVDVPAEGEVLVEVVLEATRVALQEDEIVILEKVHFAFDSAQIDPRSYKLLDEVAATILRHDLVVEVQGHTDWVGTDAYNIGLSNRRAASVRRYLLDRGVPEDRLQSKGYGESQPIATNETDEGRAQNRRVVFRILPRE